MLFINRLLLVCLLSVGVTAATPAQAANQLFDASWTVKAFGNERSGGTGDSEFYSAYAIPQGTQCNPNQPRCPFESTPTDGAGNFKPLGGSRDQALFCHPWANWQNMGTSVRPAKGDTPLTGTNGREPIPPLYRNPAFFTPAGQPGTFSCLGQSTGYTAGGKGRVQAGQPVTGRWIAVTTGTQRGGFNFAAAPTGTTGNTNGFRTTAAVGEFGAIYPYVYSYTYATLRNDAGVFGPGSGPGNFDIQYKVGAAKVASINVKQGAAKFGGTMKMLGSYTSKVCYYYNNGCLLGTMNWRYEAVGASAYTAGGMVTGGFIARYTALYYHSAIMSTSTIKAYGSRFPWTTGTVTVTAVGRGPHKTVHYAHGYDNRAGPDNLGTVQLVTPLLTRWIQSGPADFETGGIGILRIKFVPEPQMWAVLVAGASLLGVATRMRGR